MVIILAAPYQVERLEIIGSFHRENKCQSERDRAVKVGLPENMNIGCLKLEGIDLANRSNRAFQPKGIELPVLWGHGDGPGVSTDFGSGSQGVRQTDETQ